MRRFTCILQSLVFGACLVLSWSSVAFAAMPQVSRTEVTDVTPYSFSVIWSSDISSTADIKVYSDSDGLNQITGDVKVEPMPVGNGFESVKVSAEDRGVLKVRVGKLSPSASYYFKTVTADKSSTADVTESTLMGPVTTVDGIFRTTLNNSDVVPFSNDQIIFTLVEADGTPAGAGSLLVLDVIGSPYPITGYVGDGVAVPEVVINLNNVYGVDFNSQELQGKERIALKEVRDGNECLLTHFRLVPLNAGQGEVSDPLTGVDASGLQNAQTDVNVDAVVDIQDFALFAEKFGSLLGDCYYNVDYDFDGNDIVDISDFSTFASEFGNTFVY